MKGNMEMPWKKCLYSGCILGFRVEMFRFWGSREVEGIGVLGLRAHE